MTKCVQAVMGAAVDELHPGREGARRLTHPGRDGAALTNCIDEGRAGPPGLLTVPRRRATEGGEAHGRREHAQVTARAPARIARSLMHDIRAQVTARAPYADRPSLVHACVHD